ncbi:ATP-binding protein [Chryseobacterium sp. HMWF035]|uniref:tetratricopeptide repeat-containing sensor histidine kinase n=2 Tax=unclassified Chryseobacterium TaxID=2593645 RepID=UPI000D57F94E|nr:ATP-binding protein [Chryseobacterium sp. HMWF035]PVV51041.1 hypothetical protein DD829_20795 [Chryseobacterium sp. HMWF035]
MKNFFLITILLIISSCKRDNKKTEDNVNFQKAFICRESQSYDSAFYYYNLAKNDLITINDSVGTARSLINMGMIQTKKGDFLGGIESSLEANKYIKKKDDKINKNLLATNYTNLAISSNALRNFNDALSFYLIAIKYVEGKENTYICYNNIGDLLITLDSLKLAKTYLEKATLADSAVNYSRAINNLAKAKYLDDKNYNPLPEFYKALEIRQKNNDGEGLNSSFETLSTYYYDKDKKLSLEYAQKMLKEAIQNNSPDDQITALKRIIRLDPKNYFRNFIKLDSISDRVQTLRNKHKSQFAMVRYDVAQKDAENQRLISQDLIKSVGISALILLLLGTTYWYIKRQKQLKQEKELEVKNTQLEMSKKVHDVVANGLYHMMIDVQNNPEMDKTKILNDIEKMYEESRDISHENIAEKDFAPRFINMITSYSSEEQRVLPVSYKENIWENIPYNTQLELYYIIREILVNMKKHSKAKLASVKFEKNDKNLIIRYTDNGVGIANLEQQKGTGIHNTENRIESIGGDITFEKNPTGGLIIEITIPIQSKYV